jgi:pimeloyl-ACP methyl ester carboxylesterase
MPDFALEEQFAIHYETWGQESAPPVLLLHGFTGSHRMFAAQVPVLERNYRVIAPDLRGHGRTTAPEDLTTYTMDRYAADQIALLDQLGVGLAAVVGCSFGGMIALHLACHYPDRVAALVVSDASPAYDRPEYDQRFRDREANMRSTEEEVRRVGTGGVGQRLARAAADDFAADGIRRTWASIDTNGYLGAAQVRRERPDVTPLLGAKLTMPVMLCDGDEDPVYCALNVMANELPAARVVTVRGAGHGLPVVRPDVFNDLLVQFLEDVEDGKPISGRRRT